MVYSYVVDGKLNPINNITAVTSTYSVLLSDSVIISTFATSVKTITLPLAADAGVGKQFSIHSAGITSSVIRSGSDTIDGATSLTVGTQVGKTLISNGVSAYYSI